ncbi:hypothetical protein G6L37_07095 [Agrobacterium rubi]|nr:hypothetical protein [Agrobacterium rubi]NTF25132.1 hypothetical protein [Agrobacterium rubi]
MNVQNDNTTTENGSVFSRAYEINSHTMAIVNVAIQSGAVTADKVPEMIREVHKAFAESYGATTIENSVELLSAGTVIPEYVPEAVIDAAEDVEEVLGDASVEAEADLQVEERPPLVSMYDDPYDAVTDELIHCLIDGVGKKMLKRYVRAHYNLEWDEYLAAFDLPADYPSVAAKYSESKKVEALALGLGSTVPKTPKALRAAEAAEAAEAARAAEIATPRTTSERRRRQRDPQVSGRIVATQAKVA